MTPMLRATDRIRDTVRQMSALALRSRHECCWHTHQRRNGGGHGGEDGWHKQERRGKNWEKEENQKEVGVCARKSDVPPHILPGEIYSVMFLSGSNQFGRKETLQVRHTSSCDSHPVRPGGGTAYFTCTTSPLVCSLRNLFRTRWEAVTHWMRVSESKT